LSLQKKIKTAGPFSTSARALRPLGRRLLLLGLTLALAACRSASAPGEAAAFATPLSNQVEVHHDDDAHDHAHAGATPTTAELQVVLVPSELVVGPNRFAVGLFDASQHMVDQAAVHFRYYNLSDPAHPLLETEADAERLQEPGGLATIFAQERAFDRAGQWGVEVQARFPDGGTARKAIAFEVVAHSSALAAGDHAPHVNTPTAAGVQGDLHRLSSAPEPDPGLYTIGLGQALDSGKPTLLLFATPAFCQTRFCGPAYDTAHALRQRYGAQFNFIHVEVYTGLPDPTANNWETAPAMKAFGLTSEPWLYLIDGSGLITYRVEGLFTQAEVERHMQSLLAQAARK
jgi:hypothetical protein